MILVGVLGYAGAGKDEVGKVFVEHNYERRAFADALKAIATDIGWNGAKDEQGRLLLQRLGVAAREHLHHDVWVDPVMRTLAERTVITDVRFLNEVHAITQRRGVLVRVVRPGVGPANDHVSEKLAGTQIVDYTIHNNGTLAELHHRAAELVVEIESERW